MNICTLTARLILLIQLACTACIYTKLPSIISNVYDASGTPHRFAPRAILWLFLVLNIGVHILLTVIARHPNTFSLPSDLNDPDRPRQTAIAVNMLGWLQFEIAALLAAAAWEITHEHPHTRFAMLPFAIIFLALLTTTFSAIYRMMTPPKTAVL